MGPKSGALIWSLSDREIASLWRASNCQHHCFCGGGLRACAFYVVLYRLFSCAFFPLPLVFLSYGSFETLHFPHQLFLHAELSGAFLHNLKHFLEERVMIENHSVQKFPQKVSFHSVSFLGLCAPH